MSLPVVSPSMLSRIGRQLLGFACPWDGCGCPLVAECVEADVRTRTSACVVTCRAGHRTALHLVPRTVRDGGKSTGPAAPSVPADAAAHCGKWPEWAS